MYLTFAANVPPRSSAITQPDGSFGVVCCYFRDALFSQNVLTQPRPQSGHWQAGYFAMPNIAALRFRTVSAKWYYVLESERA